MNKLYPYQQVAVNNLTTGSILCGGVGSGKSLTAIAYYYTKECGGNIEPEMTPMKKPKDLYIITTARKRDTLEWERECASFLLSRDRLASIQGVSVVVDSWNNIKKYIKVVDAFFIFDEQRLVGSGAWVKSFYKIAKNNNWILLSATPGDTWLDYIPVFVANGFYKNMTEFKRRHVVYNHFSKFPKPDHYVEGGRLIRLKNQILVKMDYRSPTISNFETLIVPFDKELFLKVAVKRWHPFENRPIKDVSELCYNMRKVVNLDPSRINKIREIITKHRKVIIFYNFNFELDILRTLKEDSNLVVAEYNGHKHEALPTGESWAYLVQYTSGAEGWNCVETNTIIFYSLNYSYRIMTQAAGRVDRLNTPFTTLYYYYIRSAAPIDLAITKALKNKKDFNASSFGRRLL